MFGWLLNISCYLDKFLSDSHLIYREYLRQLKYLYQLSENKLQNQLQTGNKMSK